MAFQYHELVSEIDKLKKFAMKLSRNEHDAEDLLQATVLRAMEKQHLFQEGTDLFGWTSKIMYNLFATDYRRRTKFESKYDNENLINSQSVPSSQESQAEFNQVGEALEDLSEEHRTVLVLVCIQGMRYEEVAQTIGIPVGTVRSRLSRARDQLRQQLEQGHHSFGGQVIDWMIPEKIRERLEAA